MRIVHWESFTRRDTALSKSFIYYFYLLDILYTDKSKITLVKISVHCFFVVLDLILRKVLKIEILTCTKWFFLLLWPYSLAGLFKFQIVPWVVCNMVTWSCYNSKQSKDRWCVCGIKMQRTYTQREMELILKFPLFKFSKKNQ